MFFYSSIRIFSTWINNEYFLTDGRQGAYNCGPLLSVWKLGGWCCCGSHHACKSSLSLQRVVVAVVTVSCFTVALQKVSTLGSHMGLLCAAVSDARIESSIVDVLARLWYKCCKAIGISSWHFSMSVTSQVLRPRPRCSRQSYHGQKNTKRLWALHVTFTPLLKRCSEEITFTHGERSNSRGRFAYAIWEDGRLHDWSSGTHCLASITGDMINTKP